jgi:hypothetical protein
MEVMAANPQQFFILGPERPRGQRPSARRPTGIAGGQATAALGAIGAAWLDSKIHSSDRTQHVVVIGDAKERLPAAAAISTLRGVIASGTARFSGRLVLKECRFGVGPVGFRPMALRQLAVELSRHHITAAIGRRALVLLAAGVIFLFRYPGHDLVLSSRSRSIPYYHQLLFVTNPAARRTSPKC